MSKSCGLGIFYHKVLGLEFRGGRKVSGLDFVGLGFEFSGLLIIDKNRKIAV